LNPFLLKSLEKTTHLVRSTPELILHCIAVSQQILSKMHAIRFTIDKGVRLVMECHNGDSHGVCLWYENKLNDATDRTETPQF
jgi:hypothetical protein